jgi:hypothetical protein
MARYRSVVDPELFFPDPTSENFRNRTIHTVEKFNKKKNTISEFAAFCYPDRIENPEPVFVNIYGGQESIPRNRFWQPL